ncbi:hypothetical protein P5F52_14925 [Clostridium perfringens]|uniref:hypothetical protein n=1 Tax=Clostridium perfringens TaxID=1502 RepID=UPI0039ED6CA3|nr:hypothetical protein [Clostridium perfringens]
MISSRENTKAYHVNDEERCKKFIKDKDYIIISNDTFWLGNGMYFWDNNSNANYWLKEKQRKNSKKKYVKTKSKLYIDEEFLLDLTDEEIVEILEKLWREYCAKNNEKIRQPLGVKLDKLFKFFEEEFNQFKVIKGTGYYKNRININKFLPFDKSHPSICGGLKTIYCARYPDMIVNRMIEEG